MDYEERSRLEQKMEILADLDGCEGGDVLSNLTSAVRYSEYLQLSDEDTESFLQLIKKMVTEYEEMFGQDAVNGDPEKFLVMNKYYREDGIPEVVVEGYTPPTKEEMEKNGQCIDHPYESFSRRPLSTCEACWRIYIAKNPEKAKA